MSSRVLNGHNNADRATGFVRSRQRSPAHPIRDFAARLLGVLAALEARRRERDALHALDDRLLRDIGLTRSDVAAADERPWRP